MTKYLHVTVETSADGTVRVYGNGGLVFEACAVDLNVSTSIHQKERPNSGEFVIKKS